MRLLYNILLILVFIAGLTFLCMSFIPFHMVKPFVDSLSFGGKVSFFTPEYFSTIVHRLRLSSFLIFILFALLIIFRSFLEKQLLFLSSFSKSYYDFNNDATNKLTSLIEYDKFELLSFVFILLVGVGLRIYYLSTPIRFDEAGLFLLLSSKPLFVSLVSYPTTGHHVFYTVMVNILGNILGNDAWVIRLPALLAGILLIPAVYLLFKTISDNVTSLFAAALVATSSPLIEYSTNGRGYTTITLIFILSLLLAHYLSTHRNIFAWSLVIFLSALGFYTIPIYLFPFGIVIIWHMSISKINNPDYNFLKDSAVPALLVILITFILYSPIFAVVGFNEVVNKEYIASQTFAIFFSEIPEMINSTWNFWNRDLPSILIYVIVLGYIIFLLRIKYFNKALPILLISLILWISTVITIKRVDPQYRIWIFLIPIYLGLGSVGLSYVIRKINYHVLPLSIVITFIFLLITSLSVISKNTICNSDTGGQLLADGPEIVQYVRDNIRLNDGKIYIVNLTYRFPLMYYFRKYNLPLDHILSYKSMKDTAFVNNMNSLVAVEVTPDPREIKEKVMEDAGANISDFQPPVLLKTFKISSLYLYNKK